MKRKTKSERVQALIAHAIETLGPDITGCCGKTPQQSLSTQGDGELLLWVNTPDNSTHIVREKKNHRTLQKMCNFVN